MAWITKDTITRAIREDVEAQYKVACWFYENDIMASAYFWVKRAAQQGHFEASVMLEKLASYKK